MKVRVGLTVMVVALATGCGVLGDNGSEGKNMSDMTMQQAAERADSILTETMTAIKPQVQWEHGIFTDLTCSVSRRVSVTTIISPERRGSFLGVVERYWEKQGFTHRTANKSTTNPATYFITPDQFQIRLLFGYQGQAHFEVTTPCVKKSAVAPPQPVSGVPEYDGSEPPLPSENSDFWSANTPVSSASPSS
ncbi:hypothetical protein [Streptomyces capitiformicae]|uniref:Lipoprotein n=1 Tax=Streptomyces capitiformicae TaxID=2014920 RepID=A0A919L894_9ACTN|nr:hypothetical protein [Streptomyces capitiformicae]GHH87084.1 hypothetical protein GCM10017771_26830 [Streptomyces capitiformicae]